MRVIACHTRRSIAVYLFKPAGCLRKSCLATFDRSERSADLSGRTRMAIGGDKSRISSQSGGDLLPGSRNSGGREEGRLWQERSDAATVRRFTGGQPASAKGRFALARVLLAEGDRNGADRQVREAWRSQELSEHVEAEALDAFREVLTREDHRARMDKRIGAKDFSGAMRAARRLGSGDLSIVKACAAVAANATKALALLDAVTTEESQDLGYTLC